MTLFRWKTSFPFTAICKLVSSKKKARHQPNVLLVFKTPWLVLFIDSCLFWLHFSYWLICFNNWLINSFNNSFVVFLPMSSADSVDKNEALEFERNRERFQFLKVSYKSDPLIFQFTVLVTWHWCTHSSFTVFVGQWGAKAFRNMQIIPPGSGIVHQVNLEYLARVVFASDKGSSDFSSEDQC